MKNISDKIKFNICLFSNTHSLCQLPSVSKNWKLISENEKIWKEKLSKITQYKDETKSSKSIFSQITTLKRQTSRDLLNFAKMNLQNAKLILQTPELFDVLDVHGLCRKSNIITLIQSHPDIAKFIFHSKFAKFINTQDLFKMAKTNSETAKVILENYAFAYNLCKYDLLEIAEKDPEAKKIIFKKYPQLAYISREEKMLNKFCKRSLY